MKGDFKPLKREASNESLKAGPQDGLQNGPLCHSTGEGGEGTLEGELQRLSFKGFKSFEG